MPKPLKPIAVDELAQAGDTFLLYFKCPFCAKKQFEGFPLTFCASCRSDLTELPLILPTRIRLISGSKRKRGRPISKRQVQDLLSAQEYKCAYCYIDITTQFDVEHVVPVSVGGTNHISNLVLSCKVCNNIAGSFAFPSFPVKRNYILERRLEKLG